MSDIQLTVVREKNGNRLRCIYLGHLRVFGAKPYASENLPHEFFQIASADLREVLRLAEVETGLIHASKE